MFGVYAIIGDDIPAWLMWRIVQPYEKLCKTGLKAQLIQNALCEDISIEPGSIIVLPRIPVQKQERDETLEWMARLRKDGIIFVYECDDDIFSEHYGAQVIKVTLQENEKLGRGVDTPKQAISWLMNEVEIRREATLWTMAQCDEVTCSSAELGNYVSSLLGDKEIYVIPNAIDVMRFIQSGREQGVWTWQDRLSIGWAGGSRPEDDLRVLAEAWTEIARMYPDVVFVNSGWQSQVLKDSVPVDRYLHHKWTEFERYSTGMKVDIGCCAVQDNEFTRRKSPIKAWEYTLMGAATVGSRPLYNGECSLIAGTVQDWVYSIQKLIDDVEFRKETVDYNLKNVLDKHNLKDQYRRWEMTYKHIFEKHSTKGLAVCT